MNTEISRNLPTLALIAGPTASGKSALAIELAERANGIVINADASQLYSDLRILSARPSEQEMARVPHALFGYRDGAVACSAADWAADARAAIEQAWADRRLPVLVGGTGLYIRALLDGLAPVPGIDPAIRSEIRAMPVAESHAALTIEDPEAAARLRPSDTSRVARALEVVRSTGRPLHLWQQERIGGIGDRVRLVPTVLLPPRDWLYPRCDARFVEMLDCGAVEEVEALLARRLDPALPVMRAIGVPEIAAWMAGTLDREAMIAGAQAATRRYAKRQYTWFSRQPPPDWPRLEQLITDHSRSYIVIKLLNSPLTS